jgi:hypothetical protein
MEILKSDPSPRVSGRGALALARLGAMDAIWEILPMMHQTENVALRRQLATAVGDLLGQPAQFYHLLNAELKNPADHVFKLLRQIRGNLKRRAKAMAGASHVAAGNRLAVATAHIEVAMDHYEMQAYDEAIVELHTAAMELLRAVFGYEGPQDTAVEHALGRDGPFGVGLWFLQVALGYAQSRDSRDELLRLDALLGVHFLYSFSVTLR